MRVSQAEPFLIPTRYRSALNSLVLTTRHSASSLALRCKKTRTLQKVCPPPRPTHLAHFASCTRVFSLPAFPAALYHQSILERLKIGFKVTSLRRTLRIASDSHPLRRIITVQLALPFPNLVSSFNLFSVFAFFSKKSHPPFYYSR